MQLSIMLECQAGLTWPRWDELAAATERCGFSGLYISDHFPDSASDSLEAITALTYLASRTKVLRFGTLVSPVSVRDPVMLTRQARMIDDLSGGRMTLGIGAGWMQEEHDAFGYALGDMRTRMTRLLEGAHVISHLMKGDIPVSFDGGHFHLKEAFLKSPLQKPTTLLIGGNGPKSTLPIAAKYANVWNCQAAPVEVFKQRSALLDTLLSQAGRDPGDVRRTLFVPVACWRTSDELAQLAQAFRRYPFLATLSDTDVIDWLKTNVAAVAGAPRDVIEQLKAYEVAGTAEVMLAVMGRERVDYLEFLAADVLPHFQRVL